MIKSLYDKFKPWSAKGSVYIISDTHFDDEDCKLMNPKWPSANRQVEILNQYVHKNDTLIHLGDVGNPEYMKRIKGHKVLIMGNHDQSTTKMKEYFDEVYEGPLFVSEKLILSHEPINIDFAFNIHGHNHNGSLYEYIADDYLDIDKKYYVNKRLVGINVASDVCNYTPISLGEEIKTGILSGIKSIHRMTIDDATQNPIHKGA